MLAVRFAIFAVLMSKTMSSRLAKPFEFASVVKLIVTPLIVRSSPMFATAFFSVPVITAVWFLRSV